MILWFTTPSQHITLMSIWLKQLGKWEIWTYLNLKCILLLSVVTRTNLHQCKTVQEIYHQNLGSISYFVLCCKTGISYGQCCLSNHLRYVYHCLAWVLCLSRGFSKWNSGSLEAWQKIWMLKWSFFLFLNSEVFCQAAKLPGFHFEKPQMTKPGFLDLGDVYINVKCMDFLRKTTMIYVDEVSGGNKKSKKWPCITWTCDSEPQSFMMYFQLGNVCV